MEGVVKRITSGPRSEVADCPSQLTPSLASTFNHSIHSFPVPAFRRFVFVTDASEIPFLKQADLATLAFTNAGLRPLYPIGRAKAMTYDRTHAYLYVGAPLIPRSPPDPELHVAPDPHLHRTLPLPSPTSVPLPPDTLTLPVEQPHHDSHPLPSLRGPFRAVHRVLPSCQLLARTPSAMPPTNPTLCCCVGRQLRADRDPDLRPLVDQQRPPLMADCSKS